MELKKSLKRINLPFVGLLKSLVYTSWVISVYSALYSWLEYQTTEIWMVTKQLSPLLTTGLLLALFFGASFWRKKLSLIYVGGLIAIMGLSLWMYQVFRNQKAYAVVAPKIFEVSPNSGYQAEVIRITGLRFTPPFGKGKVLVGDEEMVVKEWSEQRLILELPVMRKKGRFLLVVQTADGRKSNPVPFTISDPSHLGK